MSMMKYSLFHREAVIPMSMLGSRAWTRSHLESDRVATRYPVGLGSASWRKALSVVAWGQ